ncbi:MAG: methionyl-tRNA formyltransferase [Candidatus Binatia bacterium]|jgi:methionyl-tRNA formyltransferase
MRIAVIANHPMGLPVVEHLAQIGGLAGLAIEPAQTPAAAQLQMVAAQLQKPFAVLEPNGFEETMKAWLAQTNADVVFVMALSLKIPDSILALPKFGFLNFHGGPLPAYRIPHTAARLLANSKSRGLAWPHGSSNDRQTRWRG